MSEFLSGLSPERVLWTFLSAAIAGGISIFLDWGLPWIPGLVVLLFGLMLWSAQSEHHVQLSETSKDSPYFLGFTLTLLALVALFSAFTTTGSSVPFQSLSPDVLFRGAAAALVTTIVGLFFRQVLLETDPIARAGDSILKTLRDDLKDHTKEFAEAQKTLVGLINRFVKEKEGMFEDEKRAFDSYVDALDDAAGRLVEVATAQSKAINEGISELKTSTDQAAKKAKSTAGNLDSIEQAFGKIRSGLDAVEPALTLRLKDFVNEERNAAQRIESASREVSKPLLQVGTELQGLQSQLQAIRQAAAAVPAVVNKAVEDADRASAQREQQISQRTGRIIQELDAIDTIVGQVVQVLQKRISGDGRPPGA